MSESSDLLLATGFAPHTEAAALRRRLGRLAEEPIPLWSGILYRAAEPKYARQEDRLDGVGACLNGGRWNPPGLRAVYGSPTPDVAMAETLALHRHYGMPLHKAMPRTFFAFRGVKLPFMLDLTAGGNRTRIRVSLARMTACKWRKDLDAHRESLTQAIARAAAAAGFSGLVVASAQVTDGRNVVIFPGVEGVAERLETLDAGTL